jgi:hypothetical protein
VAYIEANCCGNPLNKKSHKPNLQPNEILGSEQLPE